MPIRLPSVRRASAALLLLGLLALPLRAAPPTDDAHLTRVTYQIADIVVPPSGAAVFYGGLKGDSPSATQEKHLIQLITSTVEPKSWSAKGGRGTIDYHPLTMGLVVLQTPDVQEQVADLLNSLRCEQNTQVSLEVRFITADEGLIERLGLEGKDAVDFKSAAPSKSPQRVTFLDDKKVQQVLEAVQEDRRANVMQTPKATALNGQSVTVDCRQSESFVTGVTLRAAPNGNVIFQPCLDDVPVGLCMTTKPVVSADRRDVNLKLNVDLSSLGEPKADLIPVKVPISSPSKPDGETFTQLLQHPRITRLALDGDVAIPDGGTALISGWTRDQEVRNEIRTPVLSDIPYINRLFTNVGYGREKQCVLMMVTPRVVVPAEAEEKDGGK